MTTKADKVRVGVFSIASVVLLAVVLVAFGGMRFWQGRDEYKVAFAGSVYGLENGAQVFLNGIKVGAVEDITVAGDDLGQVIATISVDDGTPIHTDTRAMLQLAGITGLKVIDLRDGSLNARRLPPGSTIQQGETLLDALEQRARTLVDESTQLIQRANTVVQNLVTITEPQQFAGLAEIVADTRVASNNLAKASAGLHRTLGSLEQSASRANSLLAEQAPTLFSNANAVVLEVKGLVQNNQGTLRSAVFDLRQASRNLKDLVREVRQRPSRLLFSETQRDRRLP